MKRYLFPVLFMLVALDAWGQINTTLQTDRIQNVAGTSIVSIQDTGGIFLNPLDGQKIDLDGEVIVGSAVYAVDGQQTIGPSGRQLEFDDSHVALDWSDLAHLRITLGSGAQISSNDLGTYFDDTGFHGNGSGLTGVIGTNHSLAVYAAGTVYTLTNSDALVDFGTTDPTITVDQAGTYLIFGRAYVVYNGATYAATQTVTVHLRRTNNTAANLTNATTTATMRVITTITDSVGIMEMPPVVYTTTNTDDAISVYGSLSAAPAAGSVQVNEASIVAIRIL